MPTDAGTTTTDEKPDTPTTPPPAKTETDKASDKTDDEELTAENAAKWREMARKHERESKKAAAELDKIKAATMSETEKAIEQAKTEARSEARRELLGEMVNLAVETAAAEKLADPSFARMLSEEDRAAFQTDDGKVDRSAIAKALDDLVKRHPNLRKEKAGALPGGGKTAATGFSMNDEIRRLARGR